MPQSRHSLIEARRDQMFPVLEQAEIGRLWRFGELKSYAASDRIVATGEIAPGVFVILAGRVEVSRRQMPGHSELIVTHGRGSFMGELAQLSGRPSLVDAYAKEAVQALLIPPRRLRDLLVEEAELGERIMRALILRRVALLDVGAGGPVIIGSADHADVLRLENFLARNGHPHQRLDPKTDPCAQNADRALSHRRSGTADRSLPQWTAAAQPRPVRQGDSRAGAFSGIREDIELYIEDCRGAGDPIPAEVDQPDFSNLTR